MLKPSDRLAAVYRRIDSAAREAGRSAQDITLIAVSKQQTIDAVAALADLGQRDFGENYLQEALDKIGTLRDRRLIWHFIGQLQSNKTRAVAEHFDWVHAVDRLKIAARLSEQRPFHAPPLSVCVQVKLGNEDTKGGSLPRDLPELLGAIASLPRLQLRGLMAIPPAETDPARQRNWFAELRRLFAQARDRHASLDTLSMGMSTDLEAAIAEGATHVRIGTAVFGERLQSPA
ncbi:MAG: YggS family pyridoxal phosphate-dependent enzyme [Gammaproteobacteria bacterium]|nr:YggS family pyridoxal phosphate-dependent enzyme [Gammaproteobacteria bacterium]